MVQSTSPPLLACTVACVPTVVASSTARHALAVISDPPLNALSTDTATASIANFASAFAFATPSLDNPLNLSSRPFVKKSFVSTSALNSAACVPFAVNVTPSMRSMRRPTLPASVWLAEFTSTSISMAPSCALVVTLVAPTSAGFSKSRNCCAMSSKYMIGSVVVTYVRSMYTMRCVPRRVVVCRAVPCDSTRCNSNHFQQNSIPALVPALSTSDFRFWRQT